MNNIVQRFGAIAILTIAAIYPQESNAGSFTGKDFATWSQTSQDSYIQTSVTMVGVVLTQLQPEKARCINDWYAKDGQKIKKNTLVRKTIARYGNYHPSGTILAVLVDACGPLK